MGELIMKLTVEKLKSLIRETIRENRMNLVESKQMDFTQIMDVLRGNTNVRTVGIMSGQNPMAVAQSDPEMNKALAEKLKARIKSMGLHAEEVKGVFSGHPEESVIIFDPTIKQMNTLNAEFKQWGYVYGFKSGNHMHFSMQQMYTPELQSDPEMSDLEKSFYDSGELGARMPSDSNYASEIHTDTANPQGAGRLDNITIIQGKPVVIPLYKKYSDPPLSQLTGPDKFYHDTPLKTRIAESKKRK